MPNNTQVLLRSRPAPKVCEDNFDVQSCDEPAAPTGSDISVELAYVSVDPYMRTRLQGPEYLMKNFEIGKPIASGCVAKVVAAGPEAKFAAGDHVSGLMPWVQRQVLPAEGLSKVQPTAERPLSTFLGVAGLTGFSAYFPLMDIAKPVAGDICYVNGSAGAVGLAAGQILKALGCTVYGSAGSDEKCAVAKEHGFEECWNYKTADIGAKLKEMGKPINIFFDNVGGEQLDALLPRMAKRGRIVVCGSISQYELGDQRYGVKNLFEVVAKSIRMEGFLLPDYMADQQAFFKGVGELYALIDSGKVKSVETVTEGGLEKAPGALIGLFKGANVGKSVVKC